MTRQHLLALVLTLCAAGCRDSADMLSRDYRNLNNEAVDALMMITDESSANMMLERVIKQYPKRLQSVDDRVKNWKQNNEKDDYGSQIYSSDSMAILLIETEMNKQRVLLEEKRLQGLFRQLEGEARKSGQQGNFDAKQALPSLHALVSEGEAKKVYDQLESKQGGEVVKVLEEINRDEKLLKNSKMKALKEAFDEKVAKFKQERQIKLRL